MRKMRKRIEVLFPDDLEADLRAAAQRENRSVATLIREAVAARYGTSSTATKLAAVETLLSVEGPAADWQEMERDIEAGAIE